MNSTGLSEEELKLYNELNNKIAAASEKTTTTPRWALGLGVQHARSTDDPNPLQTIIQFVKNSCEGYVNTITGEAVYERTELDAATIIERFRTLLNVTNVNEFVTSTTAFCNVNNDNLIDFRYYANLEGIEGQPMEQGANKFKGDLHEVLCFMFLSQFGGTFGIHGVEFAPYNQVGYDLVGTNAYGDKVLIQAKFISTDDMSDHDLKGYEYRVKEHKFFDGSDKGSLETFFLTAATEEGVRPRRITRGPECISTVLITTAVNVHPRYTNFAMKNVEDDHHNEMGTGFKIFNRRKMRDYMNEGFMKTYTDVLDSYVFCE